MLLGLIIILILNLHKIVGEKKHILQIFHIGVLELCIWSLTMSVKISGNLKKIKLVKVKQQNMIIRLAN